MLMISIAVLTITLCRRFDTAAELDFSRLVPFRLAVKVQPCLIDSCGMIYTSFFVD